MCINRKWNSITFIETINNITLFGVREPNFIIKIPIRVYNRHGTIKVEDLKEGLKLLESYKNCECPDNPNCHRDGNMENMVLAR